MVDRSDSSIRLFDAPDAGPINRIVTPAELFDDAVQRQTRLALSSSMGRIVRPDEISDLMPTTGEKEHTQFELTAEQQRLSTLSRMLARRAGRILLPDELEEEYAKLVRKQRFNRGSRTYDMLLKEIADAERKRRNDRENRPQRPNLPINYFRQIAEEEAIDKANDEAWRRTLPVPKKVDLGASFDDPQF